MKEILDRHVEKLTAAERETVARNVLGSRVAAPRSNMRWVLAAAAAGLAALVVTFAVSRREPIAPQSPGVLSLPRVERSAPTPGSTPAASRVEPSKSLAVPHELGPPAARPAAPGTPAARSAEMALAIAESIARVPVLHQVTEPRTTPRPYSGRTGAVSGVITDGKQPVPFANVIVLGTRKGTMTAEDGTYRIDRLPPASYSLQVIALGHEKQTREGVQVGEGQTTSTDFQLSPMVVKQIEEIGVRATKRIDTKSSAPVQHISSEKLREYPVDNLREAVGTKGGAARRSEYGNALPAPAPPPVIPTTGGTRLPNDEPYDSMFFRNYGVNPFIATDEDSLSTFAVDVDAGSYTVTRRYIELGYLPPADAVRLEEFVNFLPQGYPRFENDDFRILVDGAPSPFGRGYHLLRVGLKGREITEQNRKPAQLTFVIDVSGSMEREDRLELVKKALRLLVDQLRDDDRIGIVIYGTTGDVLLEPIGLGESVAVPTGAGRDDLEGNALGRTGRSSILQAIDQLHPGGSTNAEEGLQLGYAIARHAFRPGVINKIVLCSDGVANVGRTGPQSILEQVRTDADRGIHLTTIGFGMGNYNDVLMEQLADKGDGNYYYVDDLKEAQRVFVENLTGTLQTIAKDAKVQVAFDPARVLRYRLLGFENRDVADRDFRNDKVDAGEIGAGHEVTALYEVKLAPRIRTGSIATVRLRYARPEREGGTQPVREIAAQFGAKELARRFDEASPRFRLDAAVAEFAEILRDSYWAKGSRLSDVLPVARNAARGQHEEAVTEFVSLVEKATRLSRSAAPEEHREEP
jgi:Ca-activated chloride channel family protein